MNVCAKSVLDSSLRHLFKNSSIHLCKLHHLPPTILKDYFAKPKEKVANYSSAGKKDDNATKKNNFGPQPCLRKELLCKMADIKRDSCDKVSVVGVGMVGIAVVNAILFQRISSHVAIVDAFPKRLEGEGMDYCHALTVMTDTKVDYDTDFCVTSNSKVVIIAAGARQKQDESRLDLVQRNTDILKTIVPPLVELSPNAVFIMVTNPVDILSWVAYKISGLPPNRIIGSGTHLDSARFRSLIAKRLGVSAASVHGFIIGEHGDSQVPLWSGVNVAGVQFRDIVPNIGMDGDEENWHELTKEVVKAGPTVRCLKGYTNTAVGLCVADITKDVLNNTQNVKAVSTLIQGHYDIKEEMYLSLPCTIGENGVTQVVRVRMTEHEKKQLQNSAHIVYEVQKDIKPC